MNENNNDSIFEFNLDEEAKAHLSGIAQWANINAIVSFITLGLTIVSTIITFVGVSRYSSRGADAGFFQLAVGVVISLLLNITLLAAATNIKKGLEQSNQGHFNLGIAKLATYFKIIGIIAIILIVLVLLFVLLLAVGGFGR